MTISSSTNSFSSYEHIAEIASQTASPPSSPSKLTDADESMSDLMSAILRSSSPEYSTTDSEESESDSDYVFEEHEDHASVIESIASIVENPDSTTNADNNEPSSDGFESGFNGSPSPPYRDSFAFEGNIWTDIAESDNGVAEVNEGFRVIFEQERIKLEVNFRRDTKMRTNEESRRDPIRLEVIYHCSAGAQVCERSNNRDKDEHTVSHSNTQDVIIRPGEELPSSELNQQEGQVDSPDIGSPMSLDYFNE
ncbi:hypothetical protein FRC12_009843 [Ceratobasidium sp. 428]|nr:hypothetical protein FRC12_009843 [Ceratobasidium sp. 428]